MQHLAGYVPDIDYVVDAGCLASCLHYSALLMPEVAAGPILLVPSQMVRDGQDDASDHKKPKIKQLD